MIEPNKKQKSNSDYWSQKTQYQTSFKLEEQKLPEQSSNSFLGFFFAESLDPLQFCIN